MFRRTNTIAFEGPAFEATMRYNLARKAAMYDEHGRFDPLRWAKFAWGRVNLPVRFLLGCIIVFYVQNRLMLFMTWRHTEKMKESQDMRLRWLRQTGKIKSEKHVIMPYRQTDDHDYLMGLPCPTSVDPDEEEYDWDSRNFKDDSYSTGDLQNERKYAK